MGPDFAELAPDEQWQEALAAAPRERFVPDVAWTMQDGLIDRNADPDAWAAAVASGDAIITQVDDGNTELTADSPWKIPVWSSSCSAPSTVFDLLGLLDPYPGDRVLEIGTGTGWTAALLSARLGAENVTSIEVDAQIAAGAKASLDRAGFAPRLLVGDGAEGDPDGTPFDRVHATCGVREMPYAWVAQTRPGGVIVAPWMSAGGGRRAVRLVVTGDSAVGRFHGAAAYMPLRAHRDPMTPIEGDVRESAAVVDPRRIDGSGYGLRVALAGLLPGVRHQGGVENPVDGTFRVVLRDLGGESHAITYQDPESGTADVHQRGSRDLWNELEAAYLAWVRLGEPGTERFGLTVDAEGEHVWLDRPDNRIREVRQ